MMYKLLNGHHNNYHLINSQFKTVYLQQRLQDGHFVLILNFKQLTGSKRNTKGLHLKFLIWMKEQVLLLKTFKILSEEVVLVYLKVLMRNLILPSIPYLKRILCKELGKSSLNLPIISSTTTITLNFTSRLNYPIPSILPKLWVKLWSLTLLLLYLV